MKTFRRAAALVAVVTAACDVASPTGPSAAPAPPDQAAMALRCTVKMAAGTMTCGGNAPAGARGARAMVVGGQGIYVQLSNGLVTWTEGTGTFQVDDVIVENLMAQMLGTPDDVTDTGVRVFFAAGPTASVGSGPVTVANPDGTDTFTAEGQPYFEYLGLIPTFGASEPKSWIFNVGPDVDEFEFGVYVDADLPHEESILRFVTEVEDPDAAFLFVWAASSTEAFAAGIDFNTAGASLARRLPDGSWDLVNQIDAAPIPFMNDIWGSSPTDVFAVGEEGAIVHWDGAAWSSMDSGLPPDGCDCLTAVTGTGPTDVWAGGDGGILTHFDGTVWTPQTSLPATDIWAMWAAAPDNVYAVITSDADGLDALYHYDGTDWEQVVLPTAVDVLLYSVWGFSASNVYVAYDDGVLHFNGVTWSDLPGLGGCSYGGVTGTATDDLFVMEMCGLRHYDGMTWAFLDTGGSPLDLSSGGANNLFVASDGFLLRGTR